MRNWGVVDLFEHLLKHCPFLIETALATVTPNAEDTDEIKAAIVGFYQFTEPENWTFEYWQSVHNWLTSILFTEMVGQTLPDKASLSLFGGLAYGAMLGKWHSSELSEAEFTVGEMQLLLFLQTNRQRIDLSLSSIAPSA